MNLGSWFLVAGLIYMIVLISTEIFPAWFLRLFQRHGKIATAHSRRKCEQNQCEDAAKFLWLDFVCFSFWLRRAHMAHSNC